MVSHVLSFLAIPPANLLLLAAVGLAAAWRWPARAQGGRAVAAACVASLLALATPAASVPLLRSLERGWREPPAGAPGAIVVLGGDVRADAGGDDIGPLTLQRLRGAAALHRDTGLPLLVTGGFVGDARTPLAAMMARSLREDFGVAATWQEPAASDTWDNARLSAALLRRDGIGAAYVVTHPWHMRRALLAFAAAGLPATAAPLAADPAQKWSPSSFVPHLRGWQASAYAIHEWLGIAWYSWRLAHPA